LCIFMILVAAPFPTWAGGQDARRLADRWDVVAGSDPVEHTAAADLVEYITQTLGCAAGADNAEHSADAAIHVGTPDTHPSIARAHAEQPFTLTDSPESFHVQYRGNDLFIVGKRPKGAMNGVYRLMQRGDAALRALNLSTLDEHGSPASRY